MKNLKKTREKKGLTQQQMADLLNIQRPTYTRYENMERQPDFELVKKIAEVLGTSIDYLLGCTMKPISPHRLTVKMKTAFYAAKKKKSC